MKIVFEGIDQVFECEEDYRWTLVIENQRKMYQIVSDIVEQTNGNDGRSVLSENNKILRIDRKLELLSQFIPFDLNRKSLINKITSKMQNAALQGEYYLQTQQVLAQWEKLCLDLSIEFPGDINFTKISADTLFKSAGIEIENQYERLSEKLLDYFELVEAYDDKKLFVLVNLRSFIEDSEMGVFLETIVKRSYNVLFLENAEHSALEYEKRYIVDADLCNIC